MKKFLILIIFTYTNISISMTCMYLKVGDVFNFSEHFPENGSKALYRFIVSEKLEYRYIKMEVTNLITNKISPIKARCPGDSSVIIVKNMNSPSYFYLNKPNASLMTNIFLSIH